MWEQGKGRPHLASSTLGDKGGVQGHCVSGGLPADSPSSVVSLSDLLGFTVLSKGSILHFKYYNGFYQFTESLQIAFMLQQKHFILSWDPIKIDFSPVIGGLPGVSVFAMSENMGMLTLSSPGGLGTEESGGERLRFTLKPSDMSVSILLLAPPSSLHVWYSFKCCLITP